MYDKTVTVFNMYENATLGVSTWYPHVIRNVDLIVDRAANQEKTGLENADKAKLHIKHISGKIDKLRYLPPKEWARQVAEDFEKTITFTEGVDFFIEGEFEAEPIDDDAYRGGLFNYLNRTRDNVFRITSCGKYDLIPHFEIGGA